MRGCPENTAHWRGLYCRGLPSEVVVVLVLSVRWIVSFSVHAQVPPIELHMVELQHMVELPHMAYVELHTGGAYEEVRMRLARSKTPPLPTSCLAFEKVTEPRTQNAPLFLGAPEKV